jgi:hypothetical protein
MRSIALAKTNRSLYISTKATDAGHLCPCGEGRSTSWLQPTTPLLPPLSHTARWHQGFRTFRKSQAVDAIYRENRTTTHQRRGTQVRHPPSARGSRRGGRRRRSSSIDQHFRYPHSASLQVGHSCLAGADVLQEAADTITVERNVHGK